MPPAPAHPGSLGDKAILLSLDRENCDLVAVDSSHGFWSGLGFKRVVDMERVEPREYEELVIYPTDVMDGSFGSGSLELFERVSSSFEGKKISLKCFSYGSDPTRKSIDYIRRTNATFSLRDEYSLERFRGFFPDKQCVLETDLAFDLAVVEPSEPIGISGNCVGVCPANRESQKYSKIIELLLEKNYNPMLIIHDLRKYVGDVALCDALSKRYGIPTLPTQDPREIKYYISKMNFVITGRMHVAIESMGVGTKVYGFDYNEKMKGTFKVRDQEHNVVENLQDIREIGI